MDFGLAAKAFAAGFAIMVLEVAGARLLYPYFGSSMVIWATIIGMFMAVMAVGYYVGGKISCWDSPDRILSTCLAAGGAIALLLPIAAPFINAFHAPWQLLILASTLAVSLPVAALSLVSPVIIEKCKGKHAGVSAGTVYSISTVGSIAGTFLSAFVFLPYFGVAATLAAAGILVIALSVAFRGSGALLPVALVVFFLYSQPVFGMPTFFYTAHIADADGTRMLLMDYHPQSALDLSNYSSPVFPYTKMMKAEMEELKAANRIAIIGAGGCTQVHHALDVFPNAQVSVVDIDPKVFEICSKYFYVNESQNVRFFVEDGRKFLENHPGQDIILLDAFSSGCSLPPNMASSEFFQVAAGSLSENGIMIANAIVRADGKMQTVFCDTVKTAFSDVKCALANSTGLTNCVIVARGRGQAAQARGEIITDDRNPGEIDYGFECVGAR